MDTPVSSSQCILAEFFSEARRRNVANARVATLAAVEDFDVLPDRSLRVGWVFRSIVTAHFGLS
jgi:hypothetical protein